MSDPQTIWKLSLALACSVGAMWMKFGSGVNGSDRHNHNCGWNTRDGVFGCGLDRGANPMKETDEHRGQIIDFETAADRVRMRRWAVANGFDRVRG